MTKNSATSALELEDFREEHPLVETARMYLRNYSAVMGLIVLSLIVVISLIGPLVYSTDPFEMVWAPLAPTWNETAELEVEAAEPVKISRPFH